MVGESKRSPEITIVEHVVYMHLRGQDFGSGKPNLAAPEYISHSRELTPKAATVAFVSTCSTLYTYCLVSDLGSSQANKTAKNKV